MLDRRIDQRIGRCRGGPGRARRPRTVRTWMPASPNMAGSRSPPTPPWLKAMISMSAKPPPPSPELYLTQQLVWRVWMSVGLSSGRSLSSMRTNGWSKTKSPTGRSLTTGMPMARRCAAGPMPERIRIGGEWKAPAARHDQRGAQIRSSHPPVRARTPTALRPSSRTLSTWAVAADLQIRPAARRLEIAVVGRDAHAVTAVDGVAADPVGFGRVEVVRPGIAEAEGRVAAGPGRPGPSAPAGRGRSGSARHGRDRAGRHRRGRPRAG